MREVNIQRKFMMKIVIPVIVVLLVVGISGLSVNYFGGFTQIHRAGVLKLTSSDSENYYSHIDESYPVQSYETSRWPWQKKYVESYTLPPLGENGGVYYFPAGNIFIGHTIELGESAFLKGQGVDKTEVIFGK